MKIKFIGGKERDAIEGSQSVVRAQTQGMSRLASFLGPLGPQRELTQFTHS